MITAHQYPVGRPTHVQMLLHAHLYAIDNIARFTVNFPDNLVLLRPGYLHSAASCLQNVMHVQEQACGVLQPWHNPATCAAQTPSVTLGWQHQYHFIM